MGDVLDRGAPRSASAVVLSGSAWLVAARIGRTVISIAGLAITARLLTPAEFGIMASSAITLVLARAITEPIIDVPAIRDHDLTGHDYRAHLWWAILVSAALSIVTWLAAPALARAAHVPDLAPALRGFALVFVPQAVFCAGNSLLRRQHQFARIARISVSNLIVTQGVTIALALAGHGWRALVGGMMVSIVLLAVQSAWPARLDLRPPRRLAPSGFSASGVGAINWAMTNLDTVFATLLLGPAATGLYSRAYNLNTQLKEPFAEIDVTIRQAFGLVRGQGKDGHQPQALAGLRLLAMAAALAAGSLIAMRHEAVTILLGKDWLGVIPPLVILLIGFPLRIARIYLDSVTVAWGSLRPLLAQRMALIAVLVAQLVLTGGRGIEWIAGALVTVQALALVMPGSPAEREVLGPLHMRLAALLPGFALMAAIIGAAEGVALVFGTLGLVGGILAKGAAMAVVALAAALLTPASWLIGPLARGRARLLGRGTA